MIQITGKAPSPASDDLYDLKAIPGIDLAAGKFRRRDGVAVMFHHHAARQKILGEEKLFERARQARGDGLAIGGDGRIHGVGKVLDVL